MSAHTHTSTLSPRTQQHRLVFGTAQIVSSCVIEMVCEGLQVVALHSYPTVFHLVFRFSFWMGILGIDWSLERRTMERLLFVVMCLGRFYYAVTTIILKSGENQRRLVAELQQLPLIVI
jgi:uncharacterized integral membrane protein